jgi:aromatic ring-opening dioxygenase catalytic subunit (LigB family)
MKPMYPEEAMPIVQLSIDPGYGPALHLQLGRLLAPLRDEGVLIIGSGLTYHNLAELRGGGRAVEASRAFDAWLQHTVIASSPEDRTAGLIAWAQAPMARAAHPQEDHLIPLMTVVGAAEDEAGATVYHQSDLFGGVTASSFRFGALPPA